MTNENYDEFVKWAWGAYSTGGIIGLQSPEGLTVEDFRAEFAEMVARFDAAWLLRSQGRPVGLMLGAESQHRTEPHVFWFPWVTSRQRLECTVKFLLIAKRTRTILVFAKEEDESFFAHVCKYGVLRRVGRIFDYFHIEDEMRPAVFYQSRRVPEK